MLDGLGFDQWINALAAFGRVAAALLAVIALLLSISTSRAEQRLAIRTGRDLAPQSLEGRDPAEQYT